MWLLVALGTIVGVLIVLYSVQSDWNAIQQTSGFAFGIGCGVLPYCLARAVCEIIAEFRYQESLRK
jgi:hypothetical protein